jgi:hypothetical protein
MSRLVAWVQNLAEETAWNGGYIHDPNYFQIFRRDVIHGIKTSNLDENLVDMISIAISFSDPQSANEWDLVQNIFYCISHEIIGKFPINKKMSRRDVAELVLNKCWGMIEKSNLPTQELAIALDMLNHYLYVYLEHTAIRRLINKGLLVENEF